MEDVTLWDDIEFDNGRFDRALSWHLDVDCTMSHLAQDDMVRKAYAMRRNSSDRRTGGQKTCVLQGLSPRVLPKRLTESNYICVDNDIHVFGRSVVASEVKSPTPGEAEVDVAFSTHPGNFLCGAA